MIYGDIWRKDKLHIRSGNIRSNEASVVYLDMIVMVLDVRFIIRTR